jgi:hypothetical protein
VAEIAAPVGSAVPLPHMTRWVEGPTLPILRAVGLDRASVHVITAFYSAGALRWLQNELTAAEVILGVRLNLHNPTEWLSGYTDAEALLNFIQALGARGIPVALFSSPGAHAKMYVGDQAAILGSANLTLRGFGAGPEIVTVAGQGDVPAARTVASDYLQRLRNTPLTDLESYVEKHADAAREARRQRRARGAADEDTLPRVRVQGPRHAAGDYQTFLNWLGRVRSAAAAETLARAQGKGQLSGHIHRNFYGLRQYLIAQPDEMDRFSTKDPDAYKLSSDPQTERRIANFVRQGATDEQNFVLDIWKTYLPEECGGRAGKHGGTIGNLNRMLPLVAKFLKPRVTARP